MVWADPRTAKYAVFNLVLMLMFIAAVAGIGMTLAARLPLPVTLFGVLVVLSSVIAYGQNTKPRFVWSSVSPVHRGGRETAQVPLLARGHSFRGGPRLPDWLVAAPPDRSRALTEAD